MKDRIKRILVEQLKYPLSMDQIYENTPLYGKGLGLDSLDLVSLVVRLENEFDIFFEADEVSASVENFGSLLRAVQQAVSRDGAATHRKKDG